MKRFVWYQAPFLAACVAIFMVSSFQNLPEIPLPFLQDKIPHAIVFAVLAVLAYRSFIHQDFLRGLSASPAVSAFLFSLFYGALDEMHQYFVPGRTMDLWDLVADAVGAAIGLSLFVYLKARTESQRERAGSA